MSHENNLFLLRGPSLSAETDQGLLNHLSDDDSLGFDPSDTVHAYGPVDLLSELYFEYNEGKKVQHRIQNLAATPPIIYLRQYILFRGMKLWRITARGFQIA